MPINSWGDVAVSSWKITAPNSWTDIFWSVCALMGLCGLIFACCILVACCFSVYSSRSKTIE